jgi:hypothetical protein
MSEHSTVTQKVTHTPGPWKAVPNPMRDDGWFVIRDMPAQPYPGQSQYMQMPPAVIPMQVPEADARLIAAAPDLLTAARDVVANRGCADPDCCVAARAHAAAVGKLVAAIAKAEGGQ